MKMGDFSINVEGNTITCKKDVLTEHSDYFKALFDSRMVECQNNQVSLHDLTYKTVKSLLECMKTGELKIQDNVTELVQAAVRLQVPRAIDTCESYMMMSLDDTNCFSFLNLAKSLSLKHLYSHAKRHTLYYFTTLIKLKEFLALDLPDLTQYLSDRHLNCESELVVLEAIDAWIKYDQISRMNSLDELLMCFHCEDLLHWEWEHVLVHSLLTQTDCGRIWLKENEGKRLCPKNEKISNHQVDSMCTTGNREEKYRQLPVEFLTVGGIDASEKPCIDICKFDQKKQIFTPFMNLSEIYSKISSKMGFRVTVIGKDMYFTGGQVDLSKTHCLDVWKYDGFKKKWDIVTTLPSPRRHHGACASKTCLYLLGGFGKYRQILDTFEEYDTINDQWQTLPRMPFPCTLLQTVLCSGKIYTYTISRLAYYDFQTASWTSLKNESDIHVYSIFPCLFNRYIYEFPYFDVDSGIIFEETDKTLKLERYDCKREMSSRIPISKEVEFGNNAVCVNGRYYMLNRSSQVFLSGHVDNLEKVTKLGTSKHAGKGCTLVAVVTYPEYKLTGDKN